MEPTAKPSTFLHYNYFLALEEDLDRLSRYVDFTANHQTFSIEIARILMIASAECDVLLKQLCKKLDDASKATSIGEYYDVLSVALPDFFSFEVTIPRFGLSLTPWIGWNKKVPPSWWTANNKVKHHRYEHFNQATLKNALDASAALFSAVLHFHRKEAAEGVLSPIASLFSTPDGRKATMLSGAYGVTRKYLWPSDDPTSNAEVLKVINGELKSTG